MLSITATELPRFLTCNGFVSVGEFSPAEQDDSEREKGVAAHWVAEQMVKNSASSFLNQKAPNGVFIDEEMLDHVKAYVSALKNSRAEIETDTSWGDQRFHIRGRADGISFNNNILDIFDLKYGWKIVSPEKNWTLISHAIGWINKNSHQLPEILYVRFTIFQPRAFHPQGSIRNWIITLNHLMVLRDLELYPVLNNPTNILRTSPECYNCSRMVNCPAAQKALMNAIDVSEESFTSELNNNQLSYILKNTERAEEIISQNLKALKELAFHKIKQGQIIEGYKIEKTSTHRKWKSGVTADIIKVITGVDVSKTDLITPKQAELKGIPEEVMSSFCERSDGGFKLSKSEGSKDVEKILGVKNESK